MKIGIVGLPNSGKTTIFNALTHGQIETSATSSGKLETHLAVVDVPDPRVDRLSEMFKPRKTIYAQIQFNDVAGLQRDTRKSSINGALLAELSQNDALMHVVRAFEDESVPHTETTVDPNRDIQILDSEFILTDLGIVEGRLERLEASAKRGKSSQNDIAERELLTRLRAKLEQEIPIRDVELAKADDRLIRGFQFMTAKPALLVLNAGDNGNDMSEQVQPYAHLHTETLVIQGKLESEIAQMPAGEARVFLEEFGIQEPGLNKAIRSAYDLLGLLSFFTVGEDEVRAWTIRKGETAVDAAGTIHSDLARGFIRAEVISYADLIACGSMAIARQRGLLRLEGRDYVVRDGDILNIRFNV